VPFDYLGLANNSVPLLVHVGRAAPDSDALVASITSVNEYLAESQALARVQLRNTVESIISGLRHLARREVALYLPVVAELDKTLQLDPDLLHHLKQAAINYDFAQAATFISDDLLQKFAFAGTPAQIAAQTAALFEAGADRVEWGTPHGLTTAAGLGLLGEKVLPAVSHL
jgi:alkanesulfonate monooxygenase SsuD/methylene tetrahydromethanopterin reductase-like flavin-dependent oxidoreductase (luciferase family)